MGNSSEAIGQTTTPGKRPHSKILVDGGDPQETARIQQLIGFVSPDQIAVFRWQIRSGQHNPGRPAASIFDPGERLKKGGIELRHSLYGPCPNLTSAWQQRRSPFAGLIITFKEDGFKAVADVQFVNGSDGASF